MRIESRWVLLTLAIAGIGICLAGLLGFLIDMVNNNLPWHPEQTVRDHYLAVGHSYSQGFAIGFFFCFFLALAAIGIGARFSERRSSSTATRLYEPES